jgi:prevent-host-death family protein
METIDIRDAQTQLARLLKRVAAGEVIIIAKAGKPVARLVPYKVSKSLNRKPGSLKGKIWISPDFDKADKEIEALFYDGPIEPPA